MTQPANRAIATPSPKTKVLRVAFITPPTSHYGRKNPEISKPNPAGTTDERLPVWASRHRNPAEVGYSPALQIRGACCKIALGASALSGRSAKEAGSGPSCGLVLA